ncbi:MAG: hypothetical protein C4290_00015, partial [Chloroflexota bacterium]
MGEAAWEPDEILSLILGQGERMVELGCRVLLVQGEAVVLRADVTPLQSGLLRAGAGVWVVCRTGRRLPATLLAVEPGPP